jgi:hypothetical protein
MVQQVRKSIIALAFLLPGPLLAQAPSAPLTIKPDAPDRYTVVPGDTLWGISQRYTDSPWRWPELWNLNREAIRNPHLIYPGYVIVLDRERGQLTIGAGTERAPGTTPPDIGAAPTTAAAPTSSAAPTTAPTPPTTASGPAGTVKIGPRIRAESLARQEIPSIPPSAIEPFLSRPLVIEPDRAGERPDHHRHPVGPRDPCHRQRRVCAWNRKVQGRHVVRVPQRQPASRSGHQPDARLRGGVPGNGAGHTSGRAGHGHAH